MRLSQEMCKQESGRTCSATDISNFQGGIAVNHCEVESTFGLCITARALPVGLFVKIN
jgi:hypothetical protein